MPWLRPTHGFSTSITPGHGRTKRYFYYRCTRQGEGPDACSGPKTVSAQRVEAEVWQIVCSLLKDPNRLRADLDCMIESERTTMRRYPAREAEAWAEKLTETDRKRSRYQDMAAEGLISFDELREKITGLEDVRKTAERELEALKNERKRIAELEQDRDALLDSLMQIGSEALDTLTPNEKHQVYRILQLKVIVREDGTPEVSGAFGEGLNVCTVESQCRVVSR